MTLRPLFRIPGAIGLLSVFLLVGGCSAPPEPPKADQKGRVTAEGALAFLKKTAFGQGSAYVARVNEVGGYSSGFEMKVNEAVTHVLVMHPSEDIAKSHVTQVACRHRAVKLPPMPDFREECVLCVMALGYAEKEARAMIEALWDAVKQSYFSPDQARVYDWRRKKDGVGMVVLHKQYADIQELYFMVEKTE